ncbi:Protein bicaudal C [Eumeta japonica]|uniref:Protein bicaudal C n=1 Tax=Eumeta variegata TaxID=151549 RepID=A0A4C1SG17_EUMVA|nr:Protein bicaudal C [Eumeta japonica]
MASVNNQICPVPEPAPKVLQRKYESYAMAAAQIPPATTQLNCNISYTPEAKLPISSHSMMPLQHSGESNYANPNAAKFYTQCFKIDRKKLEQLMTSESKIAGKNEAEYLFETIMQTTGTLIDWPRNLKMGANSRKNPRVRIVGEKREVIKAQEIILANLGWEGTRVVMKMNISHSDHSRIIGCGGHNIKRITEDTSTHIHFPNSKRSNDLRKTSNQVSVVGSLENVEKARSLLRLSTSLVISFKLPVKAPCHPSQPIKEIPYVMLLEQQYNIEVIIYSHSRPYYSLILVKGSEEEPAKRSSRVNINGTIENVYKARQQLLGNLPIDLIFDFHDHQNAASEIINLSYKYGVHIKIRQKRKQTTLAIATKGVEKFVDKIYQARQEILRLTTPIIRPEIPETYFMPHDKYFNLQDRAKLTGLLAGGYRATSIAAGGSSTARQPMPNHDKTFVTQQQPSQINQSYNLLDTLIAQGMTTEFAARNKTLTAASTMPTAPPSNSSLPRYFGSAAPGAERALQKALLYS